MYNIMNSDKKMKSKDNTYIAIIKLKQILSCQKPKNQ